MFFHRFFSEIVRRALGLIEPEDLVRNRERMVIQAISLAIALFGFYLISSTLFPQYNPVNTFRYVRGENTYNFYSTKGGLYQQLGDHLEVSADGINIKNNTDPDGSKEIAQRVAGDEASMGIVQSDVLLQEDYSEREIIVLAPAYEEKVHVFYSRAHHERILEDQNESGEAFSVDSLPMLEPEPSAFTVRFFAGARVRLKSSDSAPRRSLAANILDICGLFKQVDPVGKSFKEALESLAAGDLDVVFWTGGAPNIEARKILKKNAGKIGMMSVHPAVRGDLLRIYDRPMTQTTFGNEVYDDSDDITTLATDALLVANPNVPGWVIRDVANRLMAFQPEGSDKPEDSPLHGRDFADRIERIYRTKGMALLETGLVLILFVYAAASLVSVLLLWLVSSRKQSRYIRKITDIYSKSLAMHTELEMRSSALKVPVVAYGPRNRVNKVAEGIAGLTALIATIRDDSVTGGITVSHQRYIVQTAYNVREILRSQLARGLERACQDGCELVLKDLRDYFYAGYISRGAYHDLLGRVEPGNRRA